MLPNLLRSLEAPTPESEAAFAARYAAAAAGVEDKLREHAAVRDVTFSIVPAGQELAMTYREAPHEGGEA